MLAHMHPSQSWFTCRARSFLKHNYSGSVSGIVLLDPPSAQSPFACTRNYLIQRDINDTSGEITPPSLLLRTHAPNQNPPIALVVPYTTGLCRLLPAPAGRWFFPALSLQVFHWMLDPLPRRFPWCTYPFLPIGHRPSPNSDKVGSWRYTYNDFCTMCDFEAADIPLCSGLQLCSPLWSFPPA